MLRRSFAKSMGYSGEMLARPVVGIADSKSGFNNCHRHFPELIEAVKRGVIDWPEQGLDCLHPLEDRLAAAGPHHQQREAPLEEARPQLF